MVAPIVQRNSSIWNTVKLEAMASKTPLIVLLATIEITPIRTCTKPWHKLGFFFTKMESPNFDDGCGAFIKTTWMTVDFLFQKAMKWLMYLLSSFSELFKIRIDPNHFDVIAHEKSWWQILCVLITVQTLCEVCFVRGQTTGRGKTVSCVWRQCRGKLHPATFIKNWPFVIMIPTCLKRPNHTGML